jgi:DUF4097 and DUF4098 domain-containing protein YvlB
MRIKHVVLGVTVAAGGLLLTACDWDGFASEQFSDQETISRPVSEVRFTNDSGNVKITVGDKVEVRRIVHYRDTKPGKTYRVDGDALVLQACEERDCGVDYEVTVPEGTKVSGHADSGDVELAGVASANVQADSGNVAIHDVDGDVNASAESGNVELTGIGGAVVADADSGNVDITLSAAGNVTASASSGNVDVVVPDASYRVRTQGDHVTDEVGDDGTGPTIDLRTDSGNITLRTV